MPVQPATATAPGGMTVLVWTQLLVLGAIWGASFFFAHIALEHLPPLTLVFFRVLIAAIALHVYLAVRGPSARTLLPWAGRFAVLAVLNNIIPFSLIFLGQTRIGAGLASIINATTPFWTLILAQLLTSDEKLKANKLAGIVLGVTGTVVMIGPGAIGDIGAPLWAKLCVLGATVSYAFAAIFAKRFKDLPPAATAAGQLTASSILVLPLALIVNGTTGLAAASAETWGAVFGIALLSTAFAYILYFSIIRAAGATNASLVTLIVPASAILLSGLFLGETLSTADYAGLGLIAIGLVTIDGRVFRARLSPAT